MEFGNKQLTVLVEGNIGVGKTTFLNYIKKCERVKIVKEPVEQWQNLNGSNLLNLMYNDPKKWGFPFQAYTFLLMLQNHARKIDAEIKILERSMYSARYCFAKLLVENNYLAKEEYDILEKMYQYTDDLHMMPDFIIYLRAPPEQVFERIKERGRDEEKNINFGYIYRLHELHEDWLVHNKYNTSVPVLILDATLSKNEIQNEYEKLISILTMRNKRT